MLNNEKKKVDLHLICISFLIFGSKWFFSYYEYGLENIFIKFLFNPSGDYSYYPFVHQLSNLILNEGYSPLSQDNDLIGFPFMVALIHSIFYKMFGVLGFIIIEFICIYIFLKIFFHIFKVLNFHDSYCILISLILFSLYPLFSLFNEFNIPYALNLKQLYSSFYSLRFPRPLITNLFLFGYFVFLIKFFLNKDENKKFKNLLISFIFLGLIFSSFFYFFITCSILMLFIIIYEYRIHNLFKNKLFLYFKGFILFGSISSLFIYQIIFIEEDYLQRLGTINLTPEVKNYLFQHVLNGLLKFEFLIILFLNIIIYLVNIKLNIEFKKFLNFFFLLFISSIISPLIYLIIMDKITFFSNFVFIIALSSFLLLKINLILMFHSLFKNFFTKIKSNFFLINSLIILMLFINVSFYSKSSKINILSEGIHFNPKNKNDLRNDFIELINFTKSKLNQNNLLLTNDLHAQMWWIFSNEKKFYFPYVFYVSLDDATILKQLINAFKILRLNEFDFINYFNQNKITDWRVVNTNNYFFLGHLKYQANYLKLNDKIENYPSVTHKFIKKKSIHHTNQIILSKKEVKKLSEKFTNTEINQNLKPNLIILIKDNFIEKNVQDLKEFVITFENKNYLILEKNI